MERATASRSGCHSARADGFDWLPEALVIEMRDCLLRPWRGWSSENPARLLARLCFAFVVAAWLVGSPAEGWAQDTDAVELEAGEAPHAEDSESDLAQAEAARAAAEAEFRQLLAAELARLANAREAILAEAARQEKETASVELIRANALAWPSRVADLTSTPGNETAADALYRELIAALREVRGNLDTALDWRGSSREPAIEIPPIDPALAAGGASGERLLAYRQTLVARARELAERQPTLLHARRDALYSAMLTMNDARLALMPALSSQLRSRITGFDEAGFDQVAREVKQIVLTVRYNIATGFAGATEFGRELTQFRPGQVLRLFEILLVLFAFRIWRTTGDSLVAELQHAQEARKPPTLLSTFLAWLARLYRHSRRPLDWLILLMIVGWLFPGLFSPAPMELVWLLACWILGGATLVQLIDAMARDRSGEDPRAALRQRSLRLVAGNVIGVGLVLSLTASAVGRGAIYSWVLTVCWLLVLPVILILTTWWRERIETLAQLGASSNKVLAWVSRNTDGISGAIGRVVAGFVLLAQGARVILARRIRQLSLIREILGQRARQKASERVIADEKSGRYLPLTDEEAAGLAPHGRPIDGGLRNLANAGVIRALQPGQTMAIVGDRGHGKSTLLSELSESTALATILLEASSTPSDDILARLADELGCKATPEAIAAALEAEPRCVAVDDVQRIIEPAIGGLARFDAVLELARSTAGPSCWLFAIGEAAWPYLARARGDRPLFDQVVHLRPWTVGEIRSIVERRTASAGLSPEFELTNEDTGTMLFEDEVEPEERARRSYFNGLTEEAGGNPAIALDLWRRCLHRDRETGAVTVRTHKAPEATRLAAMPPNALFVLRCILQMDVATFDHIARATDLPPERVRETLSACEKLGVIEQHGAAWRITLFWLQDVKRLLRAQNLIVGGLP